jgi:hypothetical protein
MDRWFLDAVSFRLEANAESFEADFNGTQEKSKNKVTCRYILVK